MCLIHRVIFASGIFHSDRQREYSANCHTRHLFTGVNKTYAAFIWLLSYLKGQLCGNEFKSHCQEQETNTENASAFGNKLESLCVCVYVRLSVCDVSVSERERERERERRGNKRARIWEAEAKRPAQIDSGRNSISRQLITPVHLCKLTQDGQSSALANKNIAPRLEVDQESIAWT